MSNQMYEDNKYIEPKVIMNFMENQIILSPGSVYCFYDETKFNKHEVYPTIESFVKKLKRLKVESIVLKGKALIDHYFLEWKYKCKVNFDKIIKKMESRSIPSLKEKNLNKLKKEEELKLSKLDKDSEEYKKEKESFDLLIKKKEKEWNRKCDDQYYSNKKYFEVFSEKEIETFKYFNSHDMKRLYKAKNRSIDNLEEFRDFMVELRPYPYRLTVPMNRTLANAMKRNKRWKRKEPYFKLTSLHFKNTIKTLNNYKVGMFGSEDVTLTDSKKTIGYNLTKIFIAIKRCDEDEAKSHALNLLKELNIYKPEEIFDTYLWQHINDDVHYKILLSYVLAFGPEILIVDKSALNTGHKLTTELYKFLEDVQKKFKFIFIIYDDTMFDKDFENMVTYKVTKNGEIVNLQVK